MRFGSLFLLSVALLVGICYCGDQQYTIQDIKSTSMIIRRFVVYMFPCCSFDSHGFVSRIVRIIKRDTFISVDVLPIAIKKIRIIMKEENCRRENYNLFLVSIQTLSIASLII